MEFFATCPTGFERLLANELLALGTSRVRPLTGQVAFEGPVEDAYRVCLWSRIASRVVAVLSRCKARTSDELYEGATDIPWEEHLPLHASFAVNASGTNENLKDTRFTALRVKDAIVDHMLKQQKVRPEADPKRPDVRIVVRLSRNNAVLGIDLAGTPLFNRGYMRGRANKGLRPDYAAALLANKERLGDDSERHPSLIALASSPDHLVIEATLAACNYAPGLLRNTWGFERWAQHDAACWQRLVDEANARKQLDSPLDVYVRVLGRGTHRSKAILRSLGISAHVSPLTSTEGESELGTPHLVADLSDVRDYETAKEASWLKELAQLAFWANPSLVAVAARDALPQVFVQHESSTTLTTQLGKDELQLHYITPSPEASPLPVVTIAQDCEVPVLVAASDQFAARLKKVARTRTKWARQNDVSCYRVYDADLPDYSVSIDVFNGTDPQTGNPSGERWLQIYEYAPSKSVDKDLARSRLMDVLALAPRILNVDPKNTFLRVRKRDKGGSQYAGEAKGLSKSLRVNKGGNVPLPDGAHLIDEGGLVFEVNFLERLDCGIFLDHRDTRSQLREMAKQTKGSKRFLNLFAYTGTATCYAADGGMRYTTTVDLSRPSLDWARRNMARNGFQGREHEYVQADVIAWIREQRKTRNRWDLIFCDVPTFSNSGRMGRRSFDVQRDHVELLIGVSRLLIRGGVCLFSCNLRSFRPDEAALAKAGVTLEDITDKTIPEDFSRNKRIHHAYIIRRS